MFADIQVLQLPYRGAYPGERTIWALLIICSLKDGLACPACSRDTDALRISTGLSDTSCYITFAPVAQAMGADPDTLLCHIKGHEKRKADNIVPTELPQAFARACPK